MNYLNPIIVIERIEEGGYLPKGFMAEWSGTPESIPQGWRQVDLQELRARLREED